MTTFSDYLNAEKNVDDVPPADLTEASISKVFKVTHDWNPGSKKTIEAFYAKYGDVKNVLLEFHDHVPSTYTVMMYDDIKNAQKASKAFVKEARSEGVDVDVKVDKSTLHTKESDILRGGVVDIVHTIK